MTIPFWKPPPKEPWKDWLTYSMLVPIAISVLGFFVSGAGPAQSWMVIVSSALIVFGAEANTPGTVIGVFKKLIRNEHNSWDISALALSLLGTVINLLVTFASRTKLAPVWRDVLLNWGPLVSGFAVACDYYGGLLETGFLFGSYELRTEQWLDEKRQWDDDEARGEHATPEWATAKIEDFRRVMQRQNGGASSLNAEQLESELAQDFKLMPSDSTMKRWLKMATTTVALWNDTA
jgi:hypothetical protein